VSLHSDYMSWVLERHGEQIDSAVAEAGTRGFHASELVVIIRPEGLTVDHRSKVAALYGYVPEIADGLNRAPDPGRYWVFFHVEDTWLALCQRSHGLVVGNA
jgi:hypothetical protein